MVGLKDVSIAGVSCLPLPAIHMLMTRVFQFACALSCLSAGFIIAPMQPRPTLWKWCNLDPATLHCLVHMTVYTMTFACLPGQLAHLHMQVVMQM